MANMNLMKNPMPVQDARERGKNFSEVALGYSIDQAIDEAERCLACKNSPCITACPVGIKIPSFIQKIKEHDFEAAYQIIAQDSSLPAVCGRVCPQESQCESKCVRAIKGEAVGIGRLERFVADWHSQNANKNQDMPTLNNHKVAIVGSGPSGLTCAGELAKKGYDVTIYEALHIPGGVLVYGIPEFRLPKSIVEQEVDSLKKLGVKIETNVVIGKTITVDELLQNGFESVYIASGAGLPNFMKIPGENLKGVYSANEFLTRTNLMKAYQKDSQTPIKKNQEVVVVGGGNVAMDAARSALRLGANTVSIVYRRSEEELPARKEEIEHAKEEGIIFRLLNNPVKINADDNGFVKSITCLKQELGEPDASGRRSPHPVEGSEFDISCDCVIMAIGTSPNPLIKSTTEGLDTDRHGCILIDDKTAKTNKPHVYAGGDAVSGAATVILAMGAGKLAAKSIDEELSK